MNESAVVVEVVVPLAPSDAFALFTERIASWWPLESHSVFGSEAASLRFPNQVGGAIVEVSSSGEETTWGTVLEYSTPDRLRFSWHPGRGADTAQAVEVEFTPSAHGTVVRLRHDGWEALAGRASEVRASYATGWVAVLERFTAVVPDHR